MARTGYFGRAPRTAPSLTSTIIAIAREYQQQRDQNIMNAWNKGGIFEGKKVTDELVLQYWRDKADGVSKSDPLYDTYRQAVENLDYTIHESKMTAAYALGHKSDSEMVHFYLGWAKRIPKDSEFYRVLQRDAGQYMRSAKNASKAAEAAAKEKAYQDAQAATSKKYEAAGQFLTDTIRRLNQSGYAGVGDAHIGVVGPTIEAPDASSGSQGQDLTSFDPNDPDLSMKLMSLIAPFNGGGEQEVAPGVYMPGSGGSYQGSKQVLYHSDKIDPRTGKQGKPITGAAILQELMKHDPNYKPGQPIDVPYLTALLDRQAEGIQARIDRAKKTGHLQDAANATKEQGYIANLTRQVSAWPVEKAYLALNQTWQKVLSDPTTSPQALKAAWARYSNGLMNLSNDPRIAANDNLKTRIVIEAEGGSTDVPTLGESFTGQDVNMNGFRSKANADNIGALKQADDQIELVVRDAIKPDTDPTKNVWTYGTTGSDGVFVPNPNGTEIGPATVDAVQASGAHMTPVTIDDPQGGKPLTMMMTGVPIYGVLRDPVTGENVPPQNNQPIGWAFTFPSGTQNPPPTKIGWMAKDPSDPSKSVLQFSDVSNPPWADKLPMTPIGSSNSGVHFEVDFSGVLPVQAAGTGAPGTQAFAVNLQTNGAVVGADGKPIPGFSVVGAGNPLTATEFDPTTGQPVVKPGTLAWDPYAVSHATDVERSGLGGVDPATDFPSLTVANLMGTNDGRIILNNLDHNPDFKAQITNDGYRYSGAQIDPATGQYIPGTGDPAKQQQADFSAHVVQNSADFVGFMKTMSQSWQRITTGSPYPDQPSVVNPGTQPLTKLATDLVQKTPFEAIGKLFFGGTLTQKPPAEDTNPGSQDFLRNVGAIKVPNPADAVAKTLTQTVTSQMVQNAVATNPVVPINQPKPQQPTKPVYNAYGNGLSAL